MEKRNNLLCYREINVRFRDVQKLSKSLVGQNDTTRKIVMPGVNGSYDVSLIDVSLINEVAVT